MVQIELEIEDFNIVISTLLSSNDKETIRVGEEIAEQITREF